MTYYSIKNRRSGVDLGVYPGETEEEALDSFARAAGYDDYAEACKVTGGGKGDLDIERLEEGHGLVVAAMQAAGYDSARGFALEVLDVDERTLRRWLASERGMSGTTKQLCRAIIAHPEIVASIQMERPWQR